MNSISYRRAVAAATGRGFKSHQPDKIYTAARAKCSNQAATVLRYSPDLAKAKLLGAVALDTAYYEAL
jgi:hypothetical protein